MMQHKPTILCLEDDISYIDFYTKWFSDIYEVLRATTLPEAVGLLATRDIRLAIVDISLVPNDRDDIGGFEFVERLKSIGFVSDVPVIIVSAWPTHMRQAFRDYGVSDFIYKGDLLEDELKAEVAELISNSYPAQVLGEAPRALVIEDDPQWSNQLGNLLVNEGCDVDFAKTYAEAVDKLTSKSAQPYHLATVDIRLTNTEGADTQGLDALDKLRRLNLPIDSIVVTAAATPEQMRQALTDLHAVDFIFKQEFQPERFLRRVRRLLTHLLYLNVSVDGQHCDEPVLTVGSKYKLVVSLTARRPDKVESRSFARPTLIGGIELELVVLSHDFDVFPGTTQFLSVSSDNKSKPVEFDIVPTRNGIINIGVDCFYRTNLVRRFKIQCQSRA